VNQVTRNKANKEDCIPVAVEMLKTASPSPTTTAPRSLMQTPTPARSDRARRALSNLWPGAVTNTTSGVV
jgi:hypothetical protein